MNKTEIEAPAFIDELIDLACDHVEGLGPLWTGIRQEEDEWQMVVCPAYMHATNRDVVFSTVAIHLQELVERINNASAEEPLQYSIDPDGVDLEGRYKGMPYILRVGHLPNQCVDTILGRFTENGWKLYPKPVPLLEKDEVGRASSRLEALRQKIFDGIELSVTTYLAGTKDSEGVIVVEFPAYYDREFEPVRLRLTLYVFGPSRRYVWEGKTLDEVIDKAEADVDIWLAELQEGGEVLP